MEQQFLHLLHIPKLGSFVYLIEVLDSDDVRIRAEGWDPAVPARGEEEEEEDGDTTLLLKMLEMFFMLAGGHREGGGIHEEFSLDVLASSWPSPILQKERQPLQVK